MFRKLLSLKLWTVSLVAALLVTLLPGASSCQPAVSLPATPFTFDYELDESNIAFFIDNDGIETLLAASPFYAGAQPLPSQNTGAYDQARAKKVEEIKKEAVSLAKAAVKLKPGLAKLRSAYFSYLEAGIEAEPKLKSFARETFVQLETLLFKQVTIEAAYNSIVTDGVDNAYAQTFMDYLKVVKAAELGSLYLQDVNNLAAFAALALLSLENHQSAAIKQANAQLDKDMKALDSLRKDLLALATSLEKIDYGFKQLLTGDYYFTLAADDFITAALPDLEAKADSLTPREGLTKQDIDAIQAYLALFERWQAEVKKQADSLDKTRLIKVSAWPEAKPGYVYAAEPENNYANAYASVSGALKADEANNQKSTYFSKGWAGVKTALQGAQTIIGDGVDVVKVAAEATLKSMLGTATDVGQGLTSDATALYNSFQRSMSGVKELKSGESYLKSRGEDTRDMLAEAFDEGLTSPAVGGIAKATVGGFTGLAGAVNKLADRQVTRAQAEEALKEAYIVGILGGSIAMASLPADWRQMVLADPVLGYLRDEAAINNARELEAKGKLEMLLGQTMERNPAEIERLIESMPPVGPRETLAIDPQNWEAMWKAVLAMAEADYERDLLNLINEDKRPKELLDKAADEIFGPAPVAKPTPEATTGTTPEPTEKPTLTPVISAARDLTGVWKGTGSWTSLDRDERPVLKQYVDVVLTLNQNGNAVQGDFSFYVTRMDALNPDYKDHARSYRDNQRHSVPVNGEASVTNLYLTIFGSEKLLEFSFTTDLMSGQVSGSLSGYYYYIYGDKIISEPKAIKLVRQPATTTGVDQPVVTKLYDGTLTFNIGWQEEYTETGGYSALGQVNMSGTASFSNLAVIVKDEEYSGNAGMSGMVSGPVELSYSGSYQAGRERPYSRQEQASFQTIVPDGLDRVWNVYHGSPTGDGYIELQFFGYWELPPQETVPNVISSSSLFNDMLTDLISEQYSSSGSLWKHPLGLSGGTVNFSGGWSILPADTDGYTEKMEYSGTFTLTPVAQK